MGSLHGEHDSEDTSAGTLQEKQQIADKELDVLIDSFEESLRTQSQPPAKKSVHIPPALRHSQRGADGKPGVAAEGVASPGSCPEATAMSPIQSRPGAPKGTQSSFVPRSSSTQWQPRDTPPPHSTGWKGSRRSPGGMKTRSSVGQEAAPDVPYDLQPVGSTASSSNDQDDCQQPLVTDPRPIILFDLNGTLTKHTAARRSSGVNLMRPGIRHLRRLQEHFRLGLFSSATDWTVSDVLPMLEIAAGHGARIFSDERLILHRGHTEDAPRKHKDSGGKQWDTVKPLRKFFARMHRTFLVDDDEFKACTGERENMILVPRWNSGDADDRVLEYLVDSVLRLLDGADEATDLREYSKAISDSIFAAHQQASRLSPSSTPVCGAESARAAAAVNRLAVQDREQIRRAYELSSV